MSRDAKIGLLVVFASITLGLFLGFTEVMDREYIKVNGKDGDDDSSDDDADINDDNSENSEDPILPPPASDE
jgi:hypothetical protein